MAGHMRRAILLTTVALLASCATGKASRKPAEVLEFDPIEVRAGGADQMELAHLNEEELFALGTSSYAAEDYAKAARCFARLADGFPASRYRLEAIFNAGLAYERLNRFEEALERFRSIMDPVRGTGDALHASFRAAECYYHLDDYRPAIEILKTLAARTDLAEQDRLQAQVQTGICQIELGEVETAERTLRDAIAAWEGAREKERLDEYFPGQAQFFLGEIYRLHFERVELDPEKGEEKLAKDLEDKCELLLSAQGHYLRAIRIGDAQWATAAGFRIGALYEQLYDAMLSAKAPPNFDEEQARVYREELRKRVKVLVSKAINIYERTLAAAERIGVDNPFVGKTRKSLERMKQILLEPQERAGSMQPAVHEPEAPATKPEAKAEPTS